MSALLPIAVVDDPESVHGRAMCSSTRVAGVQMPVVWIPPDLALPQSLAGLDACSVAAVALPLFVPGAGLEDRFCGRIRRACQGLLAQRVMVFLAECGSRSDPLRGAGCFVSPSQHPFSDRLQLVPMSAGSSGASVYAAAWWSFMACTSRAQTLRRLTVTRRSLF